MENMNRYTISKELKLRNQVLSTKEAQIISMMKSTEY